MLTGLFLLALVRLVLMIVATVKAADVEDYRYPAFIRLIS